MWMSRGTLYEYMKEGAGILSVSNRIQLVRTRDSGNFIWFKPMSQIKGTAAGLEYRTFSDLASRGFI